jgi:hypothetical protein
MVSPVRIRVPLLEKVLQKRTITEEPRFYAEAFYTNQYTNVLGYHRSQPVYGSFLHVRQHMRVEIHGDPYPRVTHHFLYYFGMLSAGEHKRCKAMA